jgi:hydrogenase maturation protein HypF
VARSTFEGHAAMAVEAAASPGAAPYPFDFADGEIDWRPMWAAMLRDRGDDVPSRFHATLVQIAAAMAGDAPTVALTGGCFQNRLLLEGVAAALAGRRVLVPERAPAGDGGLALGQAWVVARGGG